MKRLLTALFLTGLAVAQPPVEHLRTDLTYLASDELEGRATPSRGLDLAADYIARQFQSAGLQPASPDGTCFQSATFGDQTRSAGEFTLTLHAGKKDLSVSAAEARALSFAPIDFQNEPVTILPDNGIIPPVTGLVVAGPAARYTRTGLLGVLQSRKPALILLFGRGRGPTPAIGEVGPQLAPVIGITSPEAMDLLNQRDLKVSVKATASKRFVLRNVAAILPGSDPALRNQYVLLTAHYDHLGRNSSGIFHGANDNGSGTVSVIEIARDLAALSPRPKRSILFMTFFGEEEGLLGSDYYVSHPLVPLQDTVAEINLEQIGRTDDNAGSRSGGFAFTGPSYSDIPAIMAEAAKAEGVKLFRRPDADQFFDRSDNYAFARREIADTTIVVTFEYPDYHGLGDTVDKIDFPNMAKVDKGIAAGIERLANQPRRPRWTGKWNP